MYDLSKERRNVVFWLCSVNAEDVRNRHLVSNANIFDGKSKFINITYLVSAMIGFDLWSLANEESP